MYCICCSTGLKTPLRFVRNQLLERLASFWHRWAELSERPEAFDILRLAEQHHWMEPLVISNAALPDRLVCSHRA